MSQEKLDTFVQAVRLRGGLFEERAELFQFAHLTFQEFLAARLLVKQRSDGLKSCAPSVLRSLVAGSVFADVWFAKDDYRPFADQYLAWLGSLSPDEQRLGGLELAAAAILEIERPAPACAAHRRSAYWMRSGTPPARQPLRCGPAPGIRWLPWATRALTAITGACLR